MLIYLCDSCGEEIKQSGTRYTFKAELYAAKTPVVFTEEDRHRDFRKEIEQLIQQMETMNPEELNDEVYIHYQFDLCKSCRDKLYQRFKSAQPLSLR
ncbi:MAG: hypothetical protein N3A72_01400 [bacterium]|nr:hypothetical protein [bacterium]